MNLSEGISSNSWTVGSSSKDNASSTEGRVGEAGDKNGWRVTGRISVSASL